MLTEKVTSDKISSGYWGYFARAKEIFLRYSTSKICPIASLTLFCVFILLNTVAHAGWSEPVRISAGGYGNPQIVACGDTIHVVSIYSAQNTEETVYLKSTDKGQTWTNRLVLSSDSCYPQFPRIILSGSRIMALWKNVYHSGSLPHDWNICYKISTNGGRTWNPSRDVLNPGWAYILYFAASGYDSLINIIVQSQAGDSLAFLNTKSTNFGQSWSAPQEIFRAYFSSVPDEISCNNIVHFVWPGFFNTDESEEVYYIKSTNGGLTWSNNIILSEADNHGSDYPSLYSNFTNQIAISWDDGKYSPYMLTGDILTRGSQDSGSTWGFEEQATFNHFALGANDIALNGDTIHIVWEDASQGLAHRSIYYTQSTDNGVSWSEPYWIDGTLDDSAYPALVISNDKVYCVWQDGRANPDTNIIGGLYITRYDSEPDAVNGDGSENLPDEIELSAYPNPFNSSVAIYYSNLNTHEINIYDIQGKLIRSFKIEGGGNGKIIWDASDALGNKVSSGEYFLKAQNGSRGTGASQNSSGLKLLYLK
jgi:hypothetical protein